MTELKNLFGNRHRRGFLSNMVFKGILEIIFSVEEPVEERLRQRLIPYPCPRFPDTPTLNHFQESISELGMGSSSSTIAVKFNISVLDGAK